ncbi:MAG: thioesterase, partial [Clostridiales bacterium]|nr:thioesterase [Clostridiales bacterium]
IIVREKLLDYYGLEMRTERSLGRSLGKLQPVAGTKPVFEKLIGYSDVDYNSHLNNARYIDYIMDCIPFSEHKRREVRALEINYLNELVPGDTIELRRADAPDDEKRTYFEGVRKEDGESVFLSTIEWA